MQRGWLSQEIKNFIFCNNDLKVSHVLEVPNFQRDFRCQVYKAQHFKSYLQMRTECLNVSAS